MMGGGGKGGEGPRLEAGELRFDRPDSPRAEQGGVPGNKPDATQRTGVAPGLRGAGRTAPEDDPAGRRLCRAYSPRSTERSAGPQQPEAAHPVLVVEDNEDLCLVVTTLLEGAGFDVVIARNGREALLRLEQGLRPSMILLDLMMPEMSGEELGEHLRELRFDRIPLVVWSGGKQAEDVARRLGAAAFLRKPSDWDAILDAVRRHSRDARA
jgi:two-component system, chemotaxis family, chemotaxis protein CheY